MMLIEDLRGDVSRVVTNEACGAEFYFLLEVNDEFEIKRADIDGDAQEELAEKFIQAISEEVLINDDVSLVDLSGADERADAIYRYDLDEIPTQLQQLNEVLATDEFELFSFDDDSLQNLKGIIILLGHGDNRLVLYKHQYPIELLKRGSGLFVRVRNQNRLEKVLDDVLRITGTFDFFKIGDQYYIHKLKTLERFFGFHQAVKNVARMGLTNIENSDLVEDIDVLKVGIEDISFARKLVKSAKNSPVLGEIPNADIITFVTTHPALRGKIEVSEAGDKLVLKTKVSQKLFLKLLNDDYLQSELTHVYYASIAKDVVQKDEGD